MTNSSPHDQTGKLAPKGYKKILKWIGIGLGALVLLVAGYVGLIHLYIRKCDNAAIPFDRQVWLSTRLYSEDYSRYQMRKDLIARFKLIGMSRQEVLDLLGPPSEPEMNSEWQLIYWLSPDCALPIDNNWLKINLTNDRVVVYDILPF